jgi:hypothetical protein
MNDFTGVHQGLGKFYRIDFFRRIFAGRDLGPKLYARDKIVH